MIFLIYSQAKEIDRKIQSWFHQQALLEHDLD